MPADLPAVILLGGDTPIGLTVTRELGERGVAVHVVARARDGVALHSRWAASAHVRPKGEDAVIDFLNGLSERYRAEFVMAVSEIDLLAVRIAADAGRLTAKVLVPKLKALRRVNDKMSTYETATAVGISVPRTWQPSSDSAHDIPDLAFPVILKWRDPARISSDLARAGLELVKSEHCIDRAALGRALARYRPVGAYPMVQEYCPGGGLGHMIYLDKGEAVLKFQHLRRAEWPPAGGSSTVCESLPSTFHGEWIERSVELLRRIEWQGAAMVEYRYDSSNDRLALMEINGRFWGSLPLAYHAGAHFAWTTYSIEGLGKRPAVAPYRSGVVCRYMIPETRRVLTLLFRPGAIDDPAFDRRPWRAVARYFLAFLRPGTRYFVFTFRDPMPFLFDMAYVLRKMLGLPVK